MPSPRNAAVVKGKGTCQGSARLRRVKGRERGNRVVKGERKEAARGKTEREKVKEERAINAVWLATAWRAAILCILKRGKANR